MGDGKEGEPGKGGNVRVGKLSDSLSEEYKDKIETAVAEVRGSFQKASGDGKKEHGKGMSYTKKAKVENPRTIVVGSPARVKYKYEETGKTAWQGPGNTADYDDEVVRESVKITLNPEADDPSVFRFDFLGDPMDEIAVLATGVSVEGKELSEEQKVDMVLDMLSDAAKAVEGL